MDNNGQVWTILDNTGQDWAILDNTGEQPHNIRQGPHTFVQSAAIEILDDE